MSGNELRYELARLRLQLGGIVVGANLTMLAIVLAVMALTS